LAEIVAFPLIAVGKLRRHRKGYVSEFDLRRWNVPELGASAPNETSAPRVVFVGAGPGELVMIDRLVAALLVLRPDVEPVFCLRDLPAIERLQRKRPNARFCAWPFDFLVPVARWLRRERPSLVVFVDRFRFTTFACGVARSGARLALVNGRSRARTSRLYRLAAPYYRWQIGGFGLLAMEDAESEAAIRPYAAPGACVVGLGSLKADAPHSEGGDGSLERWLETARDLPIVAAASTLDEDEEGIVFDAYESLRAERPARLLLVPRDPARAEGVADAARARGLAVGRRSRGEAPADVLLLDTFGELRQAYGPALAAYVGGSFGKGGGHNVMEPLRWGLPVAFGPNPGNFAALQRSTLEGGVGTRIRDASELAGFWRRFVDDPVARETVAARARALCAENDGASRRTAEHLARLLPPPCEGERSRDGGSLAPR